MTVWLNHFIKVNGTPVSLTICPQCGRAKCRFFALCFPGHALSFQRLEVFNHGFAVVFVKQSLKPHIRARNEPLWLAEKVFQHVGGGFQTEMQLKVSN